MKMQITELEGVRSALSDRIKAMEGMRTKMIEEADRKYNEAVAKFEEELEIKTINA